MNLRDSCAKQLYAHCTNYNKEDFNDIRDKLFIIYTFIACHVTDNNHMLMKIN